MSGSLGKGRPIKWPAHAKTAARWGDRVGWIREEWPPRLGAPPHDVRVPHAITIPMNPREGHDRKGDLRPRRSHVRRRADRPPERPPRHHGGPPARRARWPPG